MWTKDHRSMSVQLPILIFQSNQFNNFWRTLIIYQINKYGLWADVEQLTRELWSAMKQILIFCSLTIYVVHLQSDCFSARNWILLNNRRLNSCVFGLKRFELLKQDFSRFLIKSYVSKTNLNSNHIDNFLSTAHLIQIVKHFHFWRITGFTDFFRSSKNE